MLNLSGGFLSNFIIIPWELNVSVGGGVSGKSAILDSFG